MSFYTAGCGDKMAVSVTGPRAVNELGGPVIPCILQYFQFAFSTRGRVRSVHLAPYRTHAVGFQYERYGEISPSRTLSDSCCWVSVREIW